jgi:hypothetical protein
MKILHWSLVGGEVSLGKSVVKGVMVEGFVLAALILLL